MIARPNVEMPERCRQQQRADLNHHVLSVAVVKIMRIKMCFFLACLELLQLLYLSDQLTFSSPHFHQHSLQLLLLFCPMVAETITQAAK